MPQVKVAATTGKGKTSSAINAITGNKIARDASSGKLYVVKVSHDGDTEITNANLSPKLPKSGKKSLSLNSKGGSFTVNQKKAEKAEQVVLSFLNKSKK